MKRNMDLIRLLLLKTEGEEPIPDLSGYTNAQLVYHSTLLIEAKLIHGGVITDNKGEVQATNSIRLTWAGHEFLDAARNGTIWKKVLGQIKKAGIQVTLPLLEELLKKSAREILDLP